MIFNLVGSLGLGSQLTIVASLALVGFYLYRAAALASVVTTVVGSAVTYTLVVLLAAAGAIAAGWIDPHPAVLFEHASEAWATSGAASRQSKSLSRGCGRILWHAKVH